MEYSSESSDAQLAQCTGGGSWFIAVIVLKPDINV